ncbi:acyltransferase family protein [Allobranchiibius sp. GilTou38]|uniref:acyltransferase family protein n=1 Tax=Allobranchiibius sp. GilTou38 TaxID=2815210 RepID=UPI001AA1C450|nr:acyltransferase family protein [Allobranchiibius sp. GilTou38]MBO1767679.1 acyltransferase [Allobranchiibius sp. GilTou38]
MTTLAAKEAAHKRAANTPKKKHRPALDGVRALAIVLVMIFHATDNLPMGGFYSVDVFFVLSGYLIAGLLISENRKWGSINLVSFYVRRARRLLPGLVLAVVGITVICPYVLDRYARATMRSDGIATVFYYANWHFISEGESYFQQYGDPSPYRHMWTLAIEEQFYFVLPALMIALIAMTRGNRRRITQILVGLSVLSAVWMAWLYKPDADPSRIYYGTDCRAQSLLLGSALAVYLSYAPRRRLTRNYRRLTAIGATGMVVMAAFFLFVSYQNDFTWRGGFFVFVLATLAVIAVVELDQEGPIAAIFGFRSFAWIGKISYGLYLWHWPIFVMLTPKRVGFGGPGLFLLRFVLSFAAGAASFYLVENPIRVNGLRKWIGTLGGTLSGVLVLPLTALAVIFTTSAASGNPLVDGQTGKSYGVGGMDVNKPVRVLVLGDSVGISLEFSFPQSAFPQVGLDGNAVFGCGLMPQQLAIYGKKQTAKAAPECANLYPGWKSHLQRDKDPVVVLSVGGWEVFDHVTPTGSIVKAGTPAYAAYLLSYLNKALAQIGPNSKVVIPNVPCYDWTSSVVAGVDIAPIRNAAYRGKAVNAVLATFARQHPSQVRIADVASKLCPGGKPRDVIDGVKVRLDGVHYTVAGGKLVWGWLMPTIYAAVGYKPTAPTTPTTAAPTTSQ